MLKDTPGFVIRVIHEGSRRPYKVLGRNPGLLLDGLLLALGLGKNLVGGVQGTLRSAWGRELGTVTCKASALILYLLWLLLQAFSKV